MTGSSNGADQPLPPEALSGGAEQAARRLLGCRLVSRVDGRRVSGRIVETEAYLGGPDPASHARARTGRTPRNASMFGPPGTAYVYFTYGMHWCFNVVVGEVGVPEAVLIRALEPVFGLDVMRERRGRDVDLANGPARLCQALGIDRRLDGHDLAREPLVLLAAAPVDETKLEVTGRVGIREAVDWPLRFFLAGHPEVSRGPAAPAGPRSVLPKPGR